MECRELQLAFAMKADEWWCVGWGMGVLGQGICVACVAVSGTQLAFAGMIMPLPGTGPRPVLASHPALLPRCRKELLEMPLPVKPALTKAQAERPGDDVFQEAHQKLAQQLTERGWLTAKGDVLSPNNLAW